MIPLVAASGEGPTAPPLRLRKCSAFAGRETQEDWDYLSGLVLGLRAFYVNAAVSANGVLVFTE